jgi:hypothetical protein
MHGDMADSGNVVAVDHGALPPAVMVKVQDGSASAFRGGRNFYTDLQRVARRPVASVMSTSAMSNPRLP